MTATGAALRDAGMAATEAADEKYNDACDKQVIDNEIERLCTSSWPTSPTRRSALP